MANQSMASTSQAARRFQEGSDVPVLPGLSRAWTSHAARRLQERSMLDSSSMAFRMIHQACVTVQDRLLIDTYLLMGPRSILLSRGLPCEAPAYLMRPRPIF
jgi:hypothetical protein